MKKSDQARKSGSSDSQINPIVVNIITAIVVFALLVFTLFIIKSAG